MIKVTNNISFVRDYHGFRVTHTYPTINRKTHEPSVGSADTFHASLDQVCGKILHLACNDSKVELELEDLRNAYYTVLAEMKMLLEEKVDDSN
jgi:hypothetical protein